jgi:hypothetical protein
MKVRAIDEKGDWDFGRGQQSYKEDLDAIMQLNITHIRSWYLDCFFDMLAGIDWKNLLGLRQTGDKIRNAIRRELLKIDGVTGVVNISAHVDEERTYFVQYTESTIYGTVTGKTMVI